jgi:hypothetical protein
VVLAGTCKDSRRNVKKTERSNPYGIGSPNEIKACAKVGGHRACANKAIVGSRVDEPPDVGVTDSSRIRN